MVDVIFERVVGAIIVNSNSELSAEDQILSNTNCAGSKSMRTPTINCGVLAVIHDVIQDVLAKDTHNSILCHYKNRATSTDMRCMVPMRYDQLHA